MASFKTILDDIGHGLKVFFTDATKVAQVAEPAIAIAFPGISGLYDATVNEIIAAENAAIVAGAQNGTGPQKLAMVVAAILPTFQTYAAQNNMPTPTIATVTAWVNAAVASLNAIPASLTTTPTATTATAASASNIL
jgi:hypothetical protein